MPTLEVGKELGRRYRVVRVLGEGGMAKTYEVLDLARGLGRALKLLTAPTPDLVLALREEFAWLRQVRHPRLARVFDFASWRHDGAVEHFYTAELVNGSTLTDFARSHSEGPILDAMLDSLEALGALHALGVRHGDYKPANVLVQSDGHGILIDLGCARSFAVASGTLSGTRGYLAPELLENGAGDARSDLFAVGISLREVLGSSLAANPRLSRLVQRLTDPDIKKRPASVAEVLETLGRSAERFSYGFAKSLIGQTAALEAGIEWFRAFSKGQSGPRTLVITGASGAGKSRLLDEIVWRAELECDVVQASELRPDRVSELLARASQISASELGIGATLRAHAALVEQRNLQLLVLDGADRLGSVEQAKLLQFARLLGDAGRVALLVSAEGPILGEQARTTALAPLGTQDLNLWSRGTLSPRQLRELERITGGNPAAVEHVLNAIASGAIKGSDLSDTGALDAVMGGSGASKLLSGVTHRPLSNGAEKVLALLVALDGAFNLDEWGKDLGANVAAACLELESAGLISSDAPYVRLRQAGSAGALASTLKKSRVQEAHAVVAQRLELTKDAALAARLAFHSVASGREQRSLDLLEEHEERWRDDPLPWVSVARALARESRDSQALLSAAQVLSVAHEIKDCRRALALVLRSKPAADVRARAAVLAADTDIKLGHTRRAAQRMRALMRVTTAELRAQSAAKLSWALIQRGDYDEALKLAEGSLEDAREPNTRATLLEAAGTAALYSGHLRRARQALNEALELRNESGTNRERVRALTYKAIADFRDGKLQEASKGYEEALLLAEARALDDLLPSACLNLGTSEQQAGQLGRALELYERGQLLAQALGARSTEVILGFNRANLYADIGALDRSQAVLNSAEVSAQSSGNTAVLVSIQLLAAELFLMSGDLRAAEHCLSNIVSAVPQGSREQVEAKLGAIALLRRQNKLATALTELEALAKSEVLEQAADLSVRHALERAELALLTNDPSWEQSLKNALVSAREQGQRWLEARVEAALAVGYTKADDVARADEHRERARRLFDRFAVSLSPELRDVFWQHPERARLAEATTSFSVGQRRAASEDSERLRRLLAINRRLNSSLSLSKVIDYALDAAIELTGAERGYLLLRTDLGGDAVETDATGPAPLSIRAARNMDRERLEHERTQFSRSIADRAISAEATILTSDAESDERFRGQRSVLALELKSVLCAPIIAPTGVLGVLYLDSRAQRARFDAVDRDLLADFAEQLALALNNASLMSELERKSRAILEQKRKIEQLVRGQQREIARLSREVKTKQQGLEQRYDYTQIVGSSPALRAVFDTLDRVIDSPLNVLVMGESGTGKELIARAVHFNSPRRERPFLAVNCAALSDTLLESELFGHVRGAFTGADSDKEGLLVAARGGTLFLDELGEMPLATQVKLLRVLEEREVRPVGSTKSLPIDIRLVCATNRDLRAEVSRGAFREDLFYRVSVVAVTLPPLRERSEDIPLLCQALLERAAKDAKRPLPVLETAALRAILLQPWPGNVRQLQNTLARALVVCDGERIRVRDLDLGGPVRATRRSLSREEFETDERERILLALRNARWNVSEVAKALGIPRNTLYRKLEKYNLQRRES